MGRAGLRAPWAPSALRVGGAPRAVRDAQEGGSMRAGTSLTGLGRYNENVVIHAFRRLGASRQLVGPSISGWRTLILDL